MKRDLITLRNGTDTHFYVQILKLTMKKDLQSVEILQQWYLINSFSKQESVIKT